MKTPPFDYRGLHLCQKCWDGYHWITETRKVWCAEHKPLKSRPKDPDDDSCRKCKWIETGKKICNCQLGECECPCSRMEQNRADMAHEKRQKTIANKKAQISLLDNHA